MGNAAQARDMVSLASGDDDGAYGAYQPGGSGSSIEGGWLVLEGARGYGPYFGVARRRGPLYNQFDEVVRIGNLQGIAPLMVGRTDSNPFYGAFVGDAAAYWAYDPDGGLRIKTRSGATAIDETGITSDQFSIATADDIPTYTEDRAHIYLTKPSDGAPRLSVKMEVNGVQSFIDRIGNMTLSDFDADADGIIDLAENANSAPWAGITGKPATYAPSAHQHQASDILSLPEFDSSQISARQWMGI
jgi:hypothetical protein